MADVTMPKLSDTMDEGKILRWLKSPGEPVQAGEVLAEVETDKADMELEASTSGVLREVRLGEGELAQVGAVIAVIDEGARAGEDARRDKPPADATGTAQSAPPRAAANAPATQSEEPRRADAAPRRVKPAHQDVAPAAAPSPARAAVAVSPPGAAAASAPPPGLGLRVSPLARSLAVDLGVDLARVVGTGPGGRVTRADVEAEHRRAAGGGKPQAHAEPAAPASEAGRSRPEARNEVPSHDTGRGAPATTAPGDPPGTIRVRPAALARTAPRQATPSSAATVAGDAARVRRVPLSRMRASIARRMAESKREAPHFYVTSTVEMEAAVELRAALKQLGGAAAAVTYNHMVLKAVADALRAFPELNARFAGDAVELLDDVNLGVATAVDDGLVVPVVHRADELTLFEIAQRARELAERAASADFSSADLSGATFSVSNLGMFDVDSFVAVINPPQAAILAVGSVKQRPIVRGGALAVAHTMALTLSCDHRCLDGVRAARFLADVKRRLEAPLGLVVGEAPAAEE